MRKINNMPETANTYRYIVATNVDGVLYYWGSWNDRDKAYEVARQIKAEVVENYPKIDNTPTDTRMNCICNIKETAYRRAKKGTVEAKNLLMDMAYLNKILTTD